MGNRGPSREWLTEKSAVDDPVVHPQFRHAGKFASVVRDEHRAQGQCLGGDQGIERSDRLAAPFKRRAQPPVFLGGGLVGS